MKKTITLLKDEHMYLSYTNHLELLTFEDYFQEGEESAEINLEDYVNNIIEGGFENFKLYGTVCNCGAFGLIATVKNGEIIE